MVLKEISKKKNIVIKIYFDGKDELNRVQVSICLLSIKSYTVQGQI